MVQLHSDVPNPDAGAHVVFYKEAVEMPAASKNAGHPVFEERDFIEIIWPGNALNIIRREVNEEDKVRWPRHWAHWQQMGKTSTVGMPIEEWPVVTRAVAKMLKAMDFHTVEQVANSSDQNITRMGMACGMAPYAFRDKAKAYLDAAAGTAVATAQAQTIHDLQQQIKDLKEIMTRAGMEAPKKRGRPKKEVNGDAAQHAA